MELVYQGKTKDVYNNGDGTLTLKLKDDATGKDGVFDPGENTVGLTIDGLGRESLRVSEYYFKLLEKKGIPTHFIACDVEKATMRVKPARAFGKGLEFVCRVRADGSFVKRYGAYVKHGENLDFLVEVTIKDDGRGDPPLTEDTLTTLGIMTPEDFALCRKLTKEAAAIINENLAAKDLLLADIKFEFGKSGDKILLMDEISAGCMRVYKNDKIVEPMNLGIFILN